jgi:threonine dehydratase
MPDNSPQVKLEGVKRLGGTIFPCEPTAEARVATCAQVQRETGATLIHPFDNAQIIAGQGTVGLEILAQHPHVTRILVPLGGGGLLGGIAVAVKSKAPHVQVIGVEPEGAAEAWVALERGHVTPLADGAHSIAEGLLVTIGQRNFQIVRSMVDRIITVSDQEIAAATRQLVTRARLIVEPSGATAVAALTRYPELSGDTVCVVSGGNVDLSRLMKIIAAE